MILLNFSHPITDAQHTEIIDALDLDKDEGLIIKDIPCSLNLDRPLAPQIVALADAAELTTNDWCAYYIIINPPALSIAAVMLTVEIRGRCSYHPSLVRFKPQANTSPPIYVLAEIVDLNDQQASARERKWQTT